MFYNFFPFHIVFSFLRVDSKKMAEDFSSKRTFLVVLTGLKFIRLLVVINISGWRQKKFEINGQYKPL